MSRYWDYNGGLIGYNGRPVGGVHNLDSVYNHGVLTSAAFDSLSYIGASYDATDLSAYTFSSTSIGTAPTNDRRVFVIVANYEQVAPTGGISSATIGGQSATVHSGKEGHVLYLGTDYYCNVTIVSALVNSGTTGDVVINLGTSSNGCAIAVFAAYGTGLSSVTEVQSSSDEDDSPGFTLSGVVSGNIVLGALASDTGSGSFSSLTATFSNATFSGDFDGYGALDAGTASYNFTHSITSGNSAAIALLGSEFQAG